MVLITFYIIMVNKYLVLFIKVTYGNLVHPFDTLTFEPVSH